MAKLKSPMCSTGHGTGVTPTPELQNSRAYRRGPVGNPAGFVRWPKTGCVPSTREVQRIIRRHGGGAKGGSARASLLRAQQAETRATQETAKVKGTGMFRGFISRVRAFIGRRQA